MQYTISQMQAARRADLYNFLKNHHGEQFKAEGGELRFKQNRSVCISRKIPGYIDYATGESGNPVDFLVRHLGYSLVDAVYALCNGGIIVSEHVSPERPPVLTLDNRAVIFPEPIEGKYRQLFAYLIARKIPAEVIQMLINQKVIYQEKSHNNIVFINPERDFAELHGTLTFGKAFHGCTSGQADRFWYFRSGINAEVAYVCEAAIDAISLYVLHKMSGQNIPAFYISIAGVSKQKAIDRIKKQSKLSRVILAVDNDAAGQACRERNSEMEYIVPEHKDWNEDLMSRA